MAEETPQAAAPAAPQPALSFADQMRAIDPNAFSPDTPTHPNEPVAAEAEPAAAEPAEEKPTKGAKGKKQVVEVPADATAAELEQLKSIAAKHGLVLEDGKVTTGERVRLRQEHQSRARLLEQREREVQAKIEQATKQFEDRFNYAEAVSEFKTTRDYKKLANTLGFESWDKLQEEVIAQNTDPNYRKLRELEEWKAQEERSKQERAAQEEARQRESLRIEEQQRYMTKLTSDMAESKDPLVRTMSEDPSFVNAIFRIQQEHYNPADDSTVTPEQAAQMAARGAAKPIKLELKALYDRLHKVFGAQTPAPEPAAGTVAKPKPKTDAIPAPRVSKITKVDPSKREWMKMAEEQMRQAADEERRQRQAQGFKS